MRWEGSLCSLVSFIIGVERGGWDISTIMEICGGGVERFKCGEILVVGEQWFAVRSEE